MENKTTPKDFFIHLLNFALLYASAVSLISLWFNYINIKFPDPLQSFNGYLSPGYETVRSPMAILIVSFPIFLFLARWISKQIAFDATRKDLWIYKWLVYLTLFVSAVTVIIDLITLIYNFLGGELTDRFGLKVLVVLVVALGIFTYYLWHLRTDLTKYKNRGSILMWITPLIVLGSIIIGFFIIGSPATVRKTKFDQQRINELQGIQYNVVNYWQMNKKLPENFNELNQSILDPKTGQPYEYQVTGVTTYKLCAVFETSNIGDSRDAWMHNVGHSCFNFDVQEVPIGKPRPVLEGFSI